MHPIGMLSFLLNYNFLVGKGRVERFLCKYFYSGINNVKVSESIFSITGDKYKFTMIDESYNYISKYLYKTKKEYSRKFQHCTNSTFKRPSIPQKKNQQRLLMLVVCLYLDSLILKSKTIPGQK